MVKFFASLDEAIAERKARKLLRRFLAGDQWESYRTVGHFFHYTGQRTYQLGYKWEPRIVEHHPDGRTDHICVLFEEWEYVEWCRLNKLPQQPPADLILAHLLGLRYDETNLRDTANIVTGVTHAAIDAISACVGWTCVPGHLLPEDDPDNSWELQSMTGSHSAWPRPDKRKYPGHHSGGCCQPFVSANM